MLNLGDMEVINKQKPLKLRIPILVFSSFNIALGLISIGLQIAAIILFSQYLFDNPFDYAGAGNWAGVFYIISGGLGIGAAKKQTLALLIACTVLSALSLTCSIAATVLATLGATFYHGCYGSYFYYTQGCSDWYTIEWTLMGFSTLAIINNIVLVSLISIPTCGGGKKKDFQHAVMHQPQMIMVNGQPMYVVPQPPHGMMMQNQQPVLQSPYQLQLQPQFLPTANFINPSQPIDNVTVPSSSAAMMTKDLNHGTVPEINHSNVIQPALIQSESKVSKSVETNGIGNVSLNEKPIP